MKGISLYTITITTLLSQVTLKRRDKMTGIKMMQEMLRRKGETAQRTNHLNKKKKLEALEN